MSENTAPLDPRNMQIFLERQAALDEDTRPRVGDFVHFADGAERRISYIWRDETGAAFSIQTSDGGSWYLGNGYVSFSGSLHPGIEPGALRPTGESKVGAVWFFNHDQARAHNGVDTYATFRVFTCSEPAP